MKDLLSKRLKTSLVITSLIVVVLGPWLVSFVNLYLDRQFQNGGISHRIESTLREPTECLPDVSQQDFELLDEIVVIDRDEMTISLRMASLFLADQGARQFQGWINPQKIDEGDTHRRYKVLDYIRTDRIHTGRNLVYAAFIFQHGDCTDHYEFANQLAKTALDYGYQDARWIFAASLDRCLMSQGEAQKYGTQYTWIDGEFKLYPVDPNTTDEERALYSVQPVSDQLSLKSQVISTDTVRKHWLESWWLTLIGAGFAALAAVIGIFDIKPNAQFGWIILLIAVLLFPISMAGHYVQMTALNQGRFETQKLIWSLINALMLIVWVICTVTVFFRIVNAKSARVE